METISVDKIICEGNRKYTKDEGFEQLVQSIKTIGIIEPPVVRPMGGGRYRVVAGRRRVAAAQKLKLAEIGCVVREDDKVDDETIALSENVNRLEMHPLDEAAIFKKMADGGASVESIAKYYARSPQAIYKRLRLAPLAEELKAWFRDGILDISGAAVLAELPEEDQKRFYEQNNVFVSGAFGERDDKNKIDSHKISQFIYKAQKHSITESMKKTCEGCAKRTHNEDNDLFEEYSYLTDACLDSDCYRSKWRDMVSAALETQVLQMDEAGLKTDDKIFFRGGVPEELYKKASRVKFNVGKNETEFEILRDRDYDRTGDTQRKKDACWLVHTDYTDGIDVRRVGYKARPPEKKTDDNRNSVNAGKKNDNDRIKEFGREAVEAVAAERQIPARELVKNLEDKNINSYNFKNRISELVAERVIAKNVQALPTEELDGSSRDYLKIFLHRLDYEGYGDYSFSIKGFTKEQKEWLRTLFGNENINQISAGLSQDAQNVLHFLLLSMGFNGVPDLDEAEKIAKEKNPDNLFWEYAAMSIEEYRALYLDAAKEAAAEMLEPKKKKAQLKKKKLAETDAVRKCRICGCTDDDCQQCVEKTGEPCYWVEDDLCSACAEDAYESEDYPF
jgi:ParB/RepB/Spo0J family partition protein